MDDYNYTMECGFSYEEAQHLMGDYSDYEEDEMTEEELQAYNEHLIKKHEEREASMTAADWASEMEDILGL